MNLTAMMTDNITELLTIIIEFTQARQKVLAHNIFNIHLPDFMPKELNIGEFANLLNNAIDEHIRNNRLILCDTETIKFGRNLSFDAQPVDDIAGKELLGQSPNEYIELQINKFWENSLNQKLAAELLRQKHNEITDAE
jgi:flagellar basal body rod protein FlgB